MTSELVTTSQGNELAMSGQDAFWNDRQIAALRQIGVEKASNADLAVFHHVCQRTGLDPFARQIYMIQRKGKQTIQTGIDGFRLVARRAVDHSGETLSIGSAEWCGQNGVWTDVWLSDEPPAAARVTVQRGSGTYVAVALFREYVQFDRDGKVTSMWSTRAAGQLAKCAEALCLRKAFPQDLSGVYSTDEMQHAEQTPSRPSALAAALAEDDDPNTVEGVVVEETASDESPLLDTSGALAKRMFATINEAGITDKERLPWISSLLGREITTSKDMTEAEAQKVIDHLREAFEEPFTKESGTSTEGQQS